MIRAEELVEIALASVDFAEFQTRLGILKRWQELEREKEQDFISVVEDQS